MNLLERLKPEYLEKLEIIKKYYPTSAQKIIKSLSENQSVFGLTLDEASSICMFLDRETTLNNLINLFNE
jgi:hypothetical protein